MSQSQSFKTGGYAGSDIQEKIDRVSWMPSRWFLFFVVLVAQVISRWDLIPWNLFASIVGNSCDVPGLERSSEKATVHYSLFPFLNGSTWNLTFGYIFVIILVLNYFPTNLKKQPQDFPSILGLNILPMKLHHEMDETKIPSMEFFRHMSHQFWRYENPGNNGIDMNKRPQPQLNRWFFWTPMKRRLIGSLFALTFVVWSLNRTFVGRGSSHHGVKARCVTRRAEKDAFNKQILGRFWTKRCHSCVFVFVLFIVVVCFFSKQVLGDSCLKYGQGNSCGALNLTSYLCKTSGARSVFRAAVRIFSFSMFLHISYYFLKNLKEFVAEGGNLCLERNEQIWYESIMNHIWTDGRIPPLKLTHRREALIQYSNTNQSDPWHNFEALAWFNIDALFRSGVPWVDTTIRLCTSYCSCNLSIATGDRL